MKKREKWLAPLNRLELGEGRSLRLLTAQEVLEARREAAGLVGEERERALCSNACLLAKALEDRGRPLYADGRAVLEALRVEEIDGLARRWSQFNREENPSVLDGEEGVAARKKAWSARLMSALNGVCSGSLGRFHPRNGSGN